MYTELDEGVGRTGWMHGIVGQSRLTEDPRSDCDVFM
jgi:hypothetical protein